MNEDLYTGRTTIRQIRASLYLTFPMRDVWEMILRKGGPGIKIEGVYLTCPSSAFCNALLDILLTKVVHANPMELHEMMEGMQQYNMKYPLTMLIQD